MFDHTVIKFMNYGGCTYYVILEHKWGQCVLVYKTLNIFCQAVKLTITVKAKWLIAIFASYIDGDTLTDVFNV